MAELSGSVDTHGEEALVYAEYATEASGPFNYQLVQTIPAGTSGTTPISADVTGLEPGTEYFFRLDAEVSGIGETYSPEPYPAATTRSAVAPTATLEAPTAVTPTTAHFSGTIDPNAPEAAPTSPEVEAAFEANWRLLILCTPECGTSLPGQGTVPADNSAHPVEGDAVGLIPGTTYEVRLVAENKGGEEVAGPLTFATPPAAPAIDSTGVSAITQGGANLEASVRPNGAATTVHFDYIGEAAYLSDGEQFGAGTVSTSGTAVGSDAQDHTISMTIGGLASEGRYVFRAVATNSVETTAGAPRRFTTFGVAGGGLPDGRAYEQVTPVAKNGSNVQGYLNNVQASSDGDGITFYSQVGFPGAEGGQDFGTFLATRAPDGSSWSTQGLLPPAQSGPRASVNGWTEDLADVFDTSSQPGQSATFYLRDSASHALRPIVTTEESFTEFGYVGASDHGATVAFESYGKLLPEALEYISNLYVWDRASGQLRLGGVLNSGEPPAEGVAAGSYDWFQGNTYSGGYAARYYTQEEQALSPGGSGLVFTALGSGQVYLRVNPTAAQGCGEAGKACTYQVSAPNSGVVDPEGERPAAFQASRKDGSLILFTSSQHLTSDANTGPTDEGSDLYVYDLNAPEGERLTDITPDTEAGDPDGAEVKGVLGASADGSYVYFAAAGSLAPGAPATTCTGSGEAVSGLCNVYVWHEGTISFVAQVQANPEEGTEAAKGDLDNWRPGSRNGGYNLEPKTSRVSPDGRTLLFSSQRRLTAYDNQGMAELYRYRYGGPAPTCVSCDPSGATPIAGASLSSVYVPAAEISMPAILTRNLSANGERLFFESPDKLLPADVNGEGGCPRVEKVTRSHSCQDVYEWEADGSGFCHSTAQNGGCLYLISTGESPQPSYFGDADLEGRNAFFFTTQPLVGQDRDGLVDIYDARMEGGISGQNPAPPSVCTDEGTCKGAGTVAPGTGSAGTEAFHGPGDQTPVRSCSHLGKRAKKLSRRARHLRAAARRASGRRQARRLHHRAGRLAKQARHASRDTKSCRRSDRGAAR